MTRRRMPRKGDTRFDSLVIRYLERRLTAAL